MTKASIFASAGYFVDYTFQLIDMFWLAKLGPSVPTAISIVSVYLFFTMALNEIVGSGSVSIISQAIGSGDNAAARRKIFNVLLLKVCLGIFCMVPLFAIITHIDAAFIAKKLAVQQHVWSYAGVIWLSLVIIPVYTTLLTTLRAANLGGFAFLISLAALLINFCLTPILVFGWFGVHEMGVAGGALGAVLAQLATLVLCVITLKKHRPQLFSFDWKMANFDFGLYRTIIRIGLPVGATLLIFQCEAIILVSCMNAYSVAQSDGFGIGLRLINAIYSINVGLAVGTGVIVGNQIGAGNIAPLKKATTMFALLTILASAVLAGMVIYGAAPIVRQFVQNEEAVLFAAQFLQFALIGNIAFATSHVFIGFCEGRGTTMSILMAMGISFVLIEFPLFFAAHHFFTFVQELLWMAMIIASVTGLGLLMVSFRTALGTSDINDSGAR